MIPNVDLLRLFRIVLHQSYEFKPNSVDEADSNELKFTRNVVVLEILGADINLTAIDLPGIIHTTEKDEDRTNVDLIRELTEHYMSKERAIIIITISCKVDMDNQASTSGKPRDSTRVDCCFTSFYLLPSTVIAAYINNQGCCDATADRPTGCRAQPAACSTYVLLSTVH